jgi:hypothetical protein
MKKLYFLAIILATGAIQAQADFEQISLSQYFDGSDLSGTDDGSGIYSSIYTENNISFNTTWNNSLGSYSYWSNGWAFSNLIDSLLITQQQTYHRYSKLNNTETNFAIGQSGSEIIVNGVATFSSIQISNTSYAAYSMKNGDSFAKKFTSEDWFELTIEGFNGTSSKGEVKVMLADSSNLTPTILEAWQTVDLTSLGDVTKLTFTLNSSDVGTYGMNTPSFFAVDNIMFDITTDLQELNRLNLTIFPNPATSKVHIPNGIESLDIYSITGNLVFTELNPLNLIDVSSLTKGTYLVKAISGNSILTTRLIIK